MMMKHLFAGLLVFCCCLTGQETEALPFGRDFSVSLNPIDTVPPQQLQQRLLPVGLFLVPKVIALGQQVASLGQQVTALQQSVAGLAASITAAINEFSSSLRALQLRVSNLFTDVSNIQQMLPRCPSSAPTGSKVLGTFCYWIGTTTLGFIAARDACRDDGGTLAEPVPGFSLPLITRLRSAFPAQFVNIGTNGLWIGADNMNENIQVPNSPLTSFLLYLTTNERVVPPPVTALDVNSLFGAVLTATGTISAALAVTSNYYVCQSSTL